MTIEVRHSGFISSIHKDNLSPWYATQKENEEIRFIDQDGNQRYLNSLIIETEAPIYIQILPSEYCLYVNGYMSIDYLKASAIKVLAPIATNIRWSGCHY